MSGIEMTHKERMEFISTLIWEKYSNTLDIGAYEGYLFDLIKNRINSYVGIDINTKALRRGKERNPGVQGVIVDLEGGVLPFKDGSFDLVVCCDTLEHITTIREILKEIKRVLRRGKEAIISLPNTHYTLHNRINFLLGKKIQSILFQKYATHIHIAPIHEYRNLFREIGFLIIEEKPYRLDGTFKAPLRKLNKKIRMKIRPTLFAPQFVFRLKAKD